MINKKVEEAINKQIVIEEDSSRIYLAMASWCEVNGYPGAAKFLYQHSDEERMHMLKFVHYLNDRGGHARLGASKEPIVGFNSIHSMFEDVMKHEEFVTSSINNLMAVCMEEKDFSTANFLQWFVMEQIEEESLMRSVLDQFKLAGDTKGALFHIDKELAAMAAPAAPEQA